MASQAEQNSPRESQKCSNHMHSLRASSTERMNTPVYVKSPIQDSTTSLKITTDLNHPRGSQSTQIHINNQQQIAEGELKHLEPNSHEVYQEHKRFLENYKRQRQQELNVQRTKTWDLQEESEQSSHQSEQHLEENAYRYAVGEKLAEIHARIQRQLLNQKWDDDRPTFKLFTDFVQSKKDIERVSKEKRFIRSQQSKYLEYHQPQMPANYKPPLEYRVKSQSFQDEIELSKKAKEFVQKIQKEQQDLLGKQVLRKKKEEYKRYHEEKEKVRQQQEVKEIEKQERKLKAEQNLLLLKQKMRINQIINKQSLEELKELLHEKEQKLHEVRESLKHKDINPREIYHKAHPIKAKKRVKTSINEYTHYQENHRTTDNHLGTVQEFTKSYERKSIDTGIRAKLAIKRHRLSRPAQQIDNTTERENQFLDRYLQLPRKFSRRKLKSNKKENTTSIIEYPKSQLSQYNDKLIDEGEVPITHHNYTEYIEEHPKNNGFSIPRLQLRSDIQQQFDDK